MFCQLQVIRRKESLLLTKNNNKEKSKFDISNIYIDIFLEASIIKGPNIEALILDLTKSVKTIPYF